MVLSSSVYSTAQTFNRKTFDIVFWLGARESERKENTRFLVVFSVSIKENIENDGRRGVKKNVAYTRTPPIHIML